MTEQMIGVIDTGEIGVGLVEGHELKAPMRVYPPRVSHDEGTEGDDIHSMPMEAIAEAIAQVIHDLCEEHGAKPTVAGVGFPGIISNCVIQESPNLKQAKGARLGDMLRSALAGHNIRIPVYLYNDADVTAAGMAAVRGDLEKLIRVWTLGHGIGFGRFPYTEGVWEGGHMVVTLDPKETYCGCGGRGHLEGIMGYRAMRLRFLDMEPEEVFAAAKKGDARCMDFVRLWHRGLGAATATSIHLGGPGRFYYTGLNVRFLDLNLLKEYLWQMVKMSPLQSYSLEVVPDDPEVAVIGAAASALLAPTP